MIVVCNDYNIVECNLVKKKKKTLRILFNEISLIDPNQCIPTVYLVYLNLSRIKRSWGTSFADVR